MIIMNFSKGVGLLLLTLVAGFIIFYLFDIKLAILFVVLWVDKTIISAFRIIRYFGVELTTVASVIMAIFYGPWFAFIFILVSTPVLHALKYIFLPMPQPEWPLFVPSPYNIVDALGALVAGFVAPLQLFYALLVTAIAKDVFFAFAEKFMLSKPVDVISATTSIIFNIVAGYPFGVFVVSML